MKNYKQVLIVILLGIIALQVFFLFSDSPATKKESLEKTTIVPKNLSPEEFSRQRDIWSQKIENEGSQRAYDEFKEFYKNEPFGNQHMMAHIVGELLYAKAGIDGLGVCDSTFAFGCYHSFFSQALLANGTEIIQKLDNACIEKFGPLGSGCQHGIGHGVSEYFGPNKLVPALEACKDTTQASELSGCISGVFMEYNVPILITETTATSVPRTMENNDPYAPCPSVPKQFQASCYYEIPQWWEQGDFRDDIAKQGQLCQKVPTKDQVENCFLGLGNILAPTSDYNIEQTLHGCSLMPTEQGRVMCQAGASWSFDANPEYRSLAPMLCSNLADSAKNDCKHKAHLLNPSNL